MRTVFITGGNKGLGFEAARRLREAGHTVVIGARDHDRGSEAARRLGVEMITIDVSSDESVSQAARDYADRFGSLDVLVNNAGIGGYIGPMDDVTSADVLAVFNTNAVGVVRMTQACAPILRTGTDPTIINVSSGLGSFAIRADTQRVEHSVPSLGYSASKAAVNMLTSVYAQFLDGIRVCAVDPGYTATDFNGHSGPQTPTEGTDAVVSLVTTNPRQPLPLFSDRHGNVDW